MRRSLTAGLAAVLLASGAATYAGSLPPATAAPTTDGQTVLPIPRFSDIAGDPEHGRAFISGGLGVDEVVVVDEAGDVVGEIPDLPGATDLATDTDDGVLWVAVSQGAAIAAIDLDTLEVTRYPTGEDTCPTRLGVVAGAAWFTSECENAHRLFNVLDLSSGEVTRLPEQPGLAEVYATVPSRPHLLVGAVDGWLLTFRVTGGSDPSIVLRKRRDLGNNSIADVALTADGSRIVVAVGAGAGAAHHSVLRTRDLGLVGSYPSARLPSAVAVRDDGAVAVGALAEDYGDSHVWIYGPGHDAVAAEHYFRWPDETGIDGPSRTDVAERGLAWGDEAAFAVLWDRSEFEPPRLAVVDDEFPVGPAVGSRLITWPTVADLVADPVHGRVFVTPGIEGNGVLVLDRAGRIRRLIEHLPGATQMALSPDSRTLYVALSSGDAVAAIDTRTLRVRRFATGAYTCPSAIAVAGRRIWVEETCRGGMSALDRRTGRLIGHNVDGDVGMRSDYLFSHPAHPGSVWSVSANTYESAVVRASISEPPKRPRAVERRVLQAGPMSQDLALTPDGLHAVVTPAALASHPVLDADSLEVVALPVTDTYPLATAVRSDGLVADGLGDVDLVAPIPGPTLAAAVRLFRTALGPQVGERDFRWGEGLPRALSFGRRDLYALEWAKFGRGYLVSRLEMPPLRPVTVTADRPSYARGDRAHLVVHTTGRAMTGRVVVRRGSARGAVVAEGRPDRLGNLDLKVLVRRTTRYVAVVRDGRAAWRGSVSIPRGRPTERPAAGW